MGRLQRIVATLGPVLVLFACGASQEAEVSDPVLAAELHSQSLLEGALDRARDAEESQDEVVFEARYNPAACACPAWEIVMHGRWTRVWLEPPPNDATVLDALQGRAELDLATNPTASYAVHGRLAEPVEAETGMSYPTLQLLPEAEE